MFHAYGTQCCRNSNLFFLFDDRSVVYRTFKPGVSVYEII